MDAYLVEPDWLATELGSADLVVLDCSWYIPEAKKNARKEFEAGHIPGARFFDLDAASDQDTQIVNMLPPSALFEAVARDLGIGADTRVVIYDSSYVSARVWWMFRHFGHGNVAVLNGGIKRWQAVGRPIETGPAERPEPGSFIATAASGDVAAWTDVRAALGDGSAVVLDARTRERFTGELPSGYPGVAGGHMPGAVNLPWGKLLPQLGDHTFLSPEDARVLFDEHGLDGRPVIVTCGSGVTAAILLFQLARIGRSDVTLYDGSWHEWGQRDDLPKENL
ncbi:sulfurtransferase [Tropicimonas isoalkanivorans]|uniref:Sulfurtransferase n=1 Tax=Tropicimonas isoalkanivorans TaxID=441112 RepID=A0A1I1KQ58_9RHOB|nr:sulfurtransferase [Tropicimonas isoalkanivorans]SFC62422.1 thiosulfate/3-mercaptopyruvate sulfurtransferase [Tropicimonas isoalkanivorans]